MAIGTVYFRDGKLISQEGETKVYKMNNALYMETGRGNLISTDNDMREYIWQLAKRPYGDVLILGLGLGLASKYILSLPTVNSLTVIEPNLDVITCQSVVNPIDDERFNVVNVDLLTYLYETPHMYNFIFIDCYNVIDEDSLPFIADLVAASRKPLKPMGTLLGWLDEGTPEIFINAFYNLFRL